MSKLILGIVFLFFSNYLIAQANLQDVVYLKNGSIIRGTILEIIPDDVVKIEIIGKSVFVYLMTDVEKITREDIPHVNIKEAARIKNKGYYNETEFGFFTGKGEYNPNFGITLQTVNGYQLNRFFRVGGGVGINYYFEYSQAFLPIFARVSGDMIKHRVTPVYFADIGYGFLPGQDGFYYESESKGGVMFQAGIGLKVYTPSKAAFLITVGYHLQQSSIEYNNNWWEWGGDMLYKEHRSYRRISARVGWFF